MKRKFRSPVQQAACMASCIGVLVTAPAVQADVIDTSNSIVSTASDMNGVKRQLYKEKIGATNRLAAALKYAYADGTTKKDKYTITVAGQYWGNGVRQNGKKCSEGDYGLWDGNPNRAWCRSYVVANPSGGTQYWGTNKGLFDVDVTYKGLSYVDIQFGEGDFSNMSPVAYHEAYIVNNTSRDQGYWVEIARSSEKSVAMNSSTTIGNSVAFGTKLSKSFFGLGTEFSSTITFSESKTFGETKANISTTAVALKQQGTVSPGKANRIKIGMRAGSVRVPYTMTAAASWDAGMNGCIDPWDYASHQQNGTGHAQGCPRTTYLKIKNGGALAATADESLEFQYDMLAQWNSRHVEPAAKAWSPIKLNNWTGPNGEEGLRTALTDFYRPMHFITTGTMQFDHATHSIATIEEKTVPTDLVEVKTNNGLTLMMSKSALDKIGKDNITFGVSDSNPTPPPTPTPPPPPPASSTIDWQQLPGGLRSLSAYGPLICGLTDSNAIFCSDNGDAMKPDWFRVPGELKQLSVSSGGRIYGVTAGRELWYRTGARMGEWFKFNGAGDHIDHNPLTNEVCVTSNSVPYCAKHGIAPGSKTAKINSNLILPKNSKASIANEVSVKWQKLSGTSLRSVSAHGPLICGLNSKSGIFCSDTGDAMNPKWFQVPGNLKQLSVSNGRIYGVNSSRALYYRENARTGGWVKLNGSGDHIEHNPLTNEACHTSNGVPYCGKH